jgi:hypothetical protein
MAASNGTCSVCGAAREKGMIGDEEWDYRDGVAELTGVRIVCPDCNAVTHIGRTSSDGYYDVARDHMARVNGITPAEADMLVDEQGEIWLSRSKLSWVVEVAPDLLARHPDLGVLVGRRAEPIGEGEDL